MAHDIQNYAAHQVATPASNAHTRFPMSSRDQLGGAAALGRYDLETGAGAGDGDDLSFADFVDVINPLQHIPVVSTIYREITGDELSAPARVAGSTLYFGPIGFVASLVNSGVEAATGKDIGKHVAAFLSDDETTVAENLSASVGITDDGELSVDEWLLQPPPGSPALNGEESGAARELDPLEPVARVVSGFNGGREAVAVEALPPDILAALFGGGTIRPAGAGALAAAETPSTDDVVVEPAEDRPGLGSLGVPQSVMSGPASAMSLDGGLAGLMPPLTPDVAAYNDIDTFGAAASDSGWVAGAMDDALARYQDGASLRREARKVYVDIAP